MPAQDLITDLAIRYGFQVLGAIVILTVGFIVALVDRQDGRSATEGRLALRSHRCRRSGWCALGAHPDRVDAGFSFVQALDKFGFQIAPLVAGIGVAGLGRRHRHAGRAEQRGGGADDHLHEALPRR